MRATKANQLRKLAYSRTQGLVGTISQYVQLKNAKRLFEVVKLADGSLVKKFFPDSLQHQGTVRLLEGPRKLYKQLKQLAKG